MDNSNTVCQKVPLLMNCFCHNGISQDNLQVIAHTGHGNQLLILAMNIHGNDTAFAGVSLRFLCRRSVGFYSRVF